MVACVMYLRNNSREASLREGENRNLRGHLEINSISPYSDSMDFHFKFERNGKKLQSFEQKRSMEKVFIFLMKQGISL